ncbi:hypothetical protein GMOD_00008112 [Pyrenophora seminiperda CCB06]|uniref:F-box domain-containing protein n=1 Tax=Pyrenophora seminiperda CCB06 TaxID=1302712 RepID=A0A3M7MGI0_9PLEO|nr:hypothetical protein GMOD_00008112 [Pyrenophora seminiperda CCB06]
MSIATMAGSGSARKKAGTKRTAAAVVTESKSSRKRQKTKKTAPKAEAQREVVQKVEEPEPDVVELDQTFRFLDLPGELRNRIYEIAVEWTRLRFPFTHMKPKRMRYREAERRILPLRPLPYIGLTQTCILIRKEFRPLWLSTHAFPLGVMDGYLKAFFPLPLRASKASAEVRERIMSYSNPAGSLRLYITYDDVDLHKLLTFQLRFPHYSIAPVLEHLHIPQQGVHFVKAALQNKNPKWVSWLKQHVITQVRLGEKRALGVVVHIVIKDRHFPGFDPTSHYMRARNHDEFLKSLGLSESIGCTVEFGVHY